MQEPHELTLCTDPMRAPQTPCTAPHTAPVHRPHADTPDPMPRPRTQLPPSPRTHQLSPSALAATMAAVSGPRQWGSAPFLPGAPRPLRETPIGPGDLAACTAGSGAVRCRGWRCAIRSKTRGKDGDRAGALQVKPLHQPQDRGSPAVGASPEAMTDSQPCTHLEQGAEPLRSPRAYVQAQLIASTAGQGVIIPPARFS